MLQLFQTTLNRSDISVKILMVGKILSLICMPAEGPCVPLPDCHTKTLGPENTKTLGPENISCILLAF